MGDASALGAPVPFESDDYAQYELDRCRRDQNSFDQVLTVVSIVAALTVLIQRIRNKEHRKFPDNIFTMMLMTLCGIHLALLISIASENRVVTETTQPWQSLCQLQARMFHWCTCAAIWNVFCVVVTLNRVIVRKTPVADLVQYSRLYYATLLGLPSLAVVVCSIFAAYGPYPGLHNCWIAPGLGRLLYFHTFTIVTFLGCVVLGPPILCALSKACRNASQPQNAGLFRSLMWRQILMAVLGVVVVGTFLAGGINNMLLASHKKSAFLKRTTYPLCISSAISFSSLGLLVSIVYWSTRHQGLKLERKLRKMADVACCSRFHCYKPDEQDQDLELDDYELEASTPDVTKKSRFSLRRTVETPSTQNASPGSPYVREQLRSAFDSDGRSVVSVPPDPNHRRAHDIATNAYTSTLLEYVREQLLDELEAAEEDSDYGSSSFNSGSDGRQSHLSDGRPSFKSDGRHSFRSDGRRSIMSDGSMDDTESSYPTTPQSHFHKVVPHVDCPLVQQSLALNRTAITEL